MCERSPWPGTAARRLLDFPILHNIDTVRISPTETFYLANMLQICTQVEWEWLEIIMRLDPRLTWDDIDMRMEYVGARAAYHHTIDTTSNNVTQQAVKAKNKFVNALQTRCSRGRAAFSMLSWRERTRISKENKTRADVLKQLSADQIANNTTRGSTPGIINPLLPDSPTNRVSRRSAQSQPYGPQNEQLEIQSKRPLRALAAEHPRAPPTVPSAQQSRKRRAPPPSLTPMAIDNTRGSDHGPSHRKVKRANVDIIDLTQDDETDADSESFASNNAPTPTPFADLHMYAHQQSLWEPNRVQHTPPNWHQTGIPTHTQNPSNPFSYYPAPPASGLTPMIQPAFGAGAHAAQRNAAVNGSNWGQGWGYYYHNNAFAPLTGERNGQQYPGWEPRR